MNKNCLRSLLIRQFLFIFPGRTRREAPLSDHNEGRKATRVGGGCTAKGAKQPESGVLSRMRSQSDPSLGRTGLNAPQQGTGPARSESLLVAKRGWDAGNKLAAPQGAVPAKEKNGANYLLQEIQ